MMINNNIYCSLLQPLKHFCQKVSVVPCSHSLLEPGSRTVPWHCSSVLFISPVWQQSDPSLSDAEPLAQCCCKLMALGAAYQSPGSGALTCRQHCAALLAKFLWFSFFFFFLLYCHTFTGPVKHPKLTHSLILLYDEKHFHSSAW